RIAVRSALAAGQVEDPGPVALFGGSGEGSAAEELGVVGVGHDGQQVEWLAAHSYRGATTGSMRAALQAGQSPKRMPANVAMPRAAKMAQSGTFAGIGVSAATSPAMPPPAIIPRIPPRRVTVAASTRNCQRSEEHTSELQSRENLVCRL